MPEKDHSKFLSVSELMIRWNVCRASIYNMIRDNQLPYFKVRGATRIPIDKVEELETGARR